jgi:hypothetical protein
MLLKNEFYHMINHLGLEDGELALAEIVWEKAERAMQGKPVQEAKLLKNDVFTRNEKPNDLTQAELQMLTDGLALVLTGDEQELTKAKQRIQILWNKSNPDDKDSVTYFDMMNEYRTQQRKMKKAHKALARIQHKLKKQMGR